MAVVRVPKTPPDAYDENRVVSSLLMSQIERLQQVVREQIQTEGEAAEYIKELTGRVWASNAQTVPKRFGAPSLTRSAKRKAAPRKARRKGQDGKAARQRSQRTVKGASKRAKKAARGSTRPRKARR